MDWCTHLLRTFGGGRSHCVQDIATGDETWVYQHDPETEQQSTVWVFSDDNPPVNLKTKEKRRKRKRVSKQTMVCFFGKSHRVGSNCLRTKRQLRLTGMSATVCLKSFRHDSNGAPQTGVRGLLFHHGNVSARTAAVTLDRLAAGDVQQAIHPPQSPDLAPSDWGLFPSLMRHRLVGLVVKASASRAEGPGFESRLRQDFFGVESYQ